MRIHAKKKNSLSCVLRWETQRRLKGAAAQLGGKLARRGVGKIKLKSGVFTGPNLRLFTCTDQSTVNLLRPVVVKEKVQHLLYGADQEVRAAAAAAAKSLQSCLTLCDPMDGSPPGSPVPGILQARTLEWVAI